MSKLQKWCPNYTQVCTLAEPGGCLTGAKGYAPGLSAPKRPVSVMAQNLLGNTQHVSAGIVFLPTCLLQGRGGQKL